MDDQKRGRIAKAFGVEPDAVTEDHEAAYDEMIAEAKSAEEPAPKPAPKMAPKPETDPVFAKALAALEAKTAELEEKSLALDRKLSEPADRPAEVRPQFELNAKALIDPPRATTSDAEMQKHMEEFQEFNDNQTFLCAILSNGGRRQVNPRDTKYWKRWVKEHGQFGEFVDQYKGFWEGHNRDLDDVVPDHAKATFTTTTGSDYIPTILSNRFIETMRHELSAAAAVMQIDMPGKNLDLPGEGADVTVYPASETVTVTQSDTDDRKSSLNAVDIKAAGKYTDDIDEDSIIPVLPLYRRKQAVAMAEGIEFAVIHGDTDDTQGQSSNSTMPQYTMYAAWNGLHAQAISATTGEVSASNALWDGQDALAQIDALDAYAKVGEAAWLVHPVLWSRTRMMVDYQGTGYRSMILVPNGNTSPITGMPCDDLLGFPILKSGQVCKNLASTGYYDGASTGGTVAYLFNRMAFALGDRRAVTVETDKTITNGVIDIVTTWRGDFACLYATTADCISACISIDYDATPG